VWGRVRNVFMKGMECAIKYRVLCGGGVGCLKLGGGLNRAKILNVPGKSN